jgi:hypothetical protein
VDNFSLSFSGAHNQQVTSSIIQEVLARHPSAKEDDVRGKLIIIMVKTLIDIENSF